MITTSSPASILTRSLLAAGMLAVAPVAWSDHHNQDHGHNDHGHEAHGHDAHNHDENRQLGAHVHGAAQLLVAVDHDQVTVLLSSPSINVVGFEHYAQNDADRDALQTARKLLATPANVFALTAAAQCALETAHIQSEQLADMQGDEPQESHHGHNEHEDHGHHALGHDEHGHDSHGHDSHGHNDHEHGHDDHGHDDHGHDRADGSLHSEFNVEYEFHCDSPNRLTGLQVNVFDAFNGFESVDVQWILDGEQGAQRSQPRSTQVNF